MKKHIATHCLVIALATVQVEQANAFSGSTLPQVIIKICKKNPVVCNLWYQNPTRIKFFQRSGRVPNPPISRLPDALPEDEIIDLMRIAKKPGGLDDIGKLLAPRKLFYEVLEDTWMRIAIGQGKFSRASAEGMFKRLSGTPGFPKTLRKICGNNKNAVIGHRNELEIADAATKKGFKVQEIGKPFDDKQKRRLTDIDVIIEKGGTIFPIEAKKFAQSPPMDMVRADMDTLVAFSRSLGVSRVKPVFSMAQFPRGGTFTLLEHEARKRGIHLVFGSPEHQILQIAQLLRIR